MMARGSEVEPFDGLGVLLGAVAYAIRYHT